MAYIAIKSKTHNSAKLYIESLDKSWSNGTRTVSWYLGYPNSSRPTETSFYKWSPGLDIENQASSGGDVEFGGLESNTRYYVYCQVYHGSSLLAEFEGEFKTDNESTTQYWAMIGESQIDVDDYGTSIYGELYNYSVIRYPVTFPDNGYVDITFGGDTDTVVYISRSDDIDYTTGEPLSYDDYDVGYNGIIQNYYVTDTETYYIYVRCYSGTESGSFWVDITSPWNWASGYITVLESGISESKRLLKGTLHRWTAVFPKSGTVTISITGDYPAMCWVGTSPDFGTGCPLDYDAYGEWIDISIPYSVEPNRNYYIWLRSYDHTSSGTVTLNISYDETPSTIAKWSWSASNGNASADVTLASYYSLSKGTPTTSFSHLVWNDMVDKAWEIIRAKTNWWDENYASYYNTKMHSEPYELTAVMFNSLRNNIELIGNRSDVLGYKTGIGVVYAKDTDYQVKAEYFTTLANYINSCIDNL